MALSAAVVADASPAIHAAAAREVAADVRARHPEADSTHRRLLRAFALALDRPRLVELSEGSASMAASSVPSVPPARMVRSISRLRHDAGSMAR